MKTNESKTAGNALPKVEKTSTQQVAAAAGVGTAAGGKLEMVGGDEVLMSPAEVENMRVIEDLGRKIILKTGEVGVLYRGLVMYIREQSVSPRFASWKLGQLGFHKVRVSEIIRVAMAPDDVYEDYLATTIGFNKALCLARIGSEGKVEQTPALEVLAREKFIEEKDFDSIETDTVGEVTSPPKKPDTRLKTLSAVNTIFRYAKRSAEWASGDGWVLTLTKAKPAKKSENKGAAAQSPKA